MYRRLRTTTRVAILCVTTVCVTAACRQKTEERPGLAAPHPRPVSLVAALGGRLAVLASLDGSPSYVDATMTALYRSSERAPGVQGQFTDVSSIAVTADGRSLIVVNGARDCRTRGIRGGIVPTRDRPRCHGNRSTGTCRRWSGWCFLR